MSAIAGSVHQRISQETIKSMLETMKRRGPDGQGAYFGKNCTMLQRYGSADGKEKNLPCAMEQGAQSYIMVLDGNIYDRVHLLQQLSGTEEESDGELILRAYRKWGVDCAGYLSGVFSFAVYDKKKESLFLARDKMGVKPLFYKKTEEGLLFASEIKTILACPEVKRKVTRKSVAELMLLGPARVPGSGIFEGIEELEPGTFLYYEKGKILKKRYWRLEPKIHRESFQETAEHVRYLVEKAILEQSEGPVPVGTFLSGGLDSSIISAVCAREAKKEGRRLSTYSLDFQNNSVFFVPGKFQPSQDYTYACQMSQALNTDAHWTVLNPLDQAEILEDAMIARDLPGMADVDGSLLLFCREIAKTERIMLSGECADEIFGGYPWFRDPKVRSSKGFPWAQNIEYRFSFLREHIAGDINPEQLVMGHYMQTAQSSLSLPDASPEDREIQKMVGLNMWWFMQTLLERTDRMSGWCGLEVRVPFCQWEVAEYLYSIPWKMKDYEGREKGLLRYAFRDLLPEEILKRKKCPYPKSYDPAYLRIMEKRLNKILEEGSAPVLEILRQESLKKLMQEDYQQPFFGQLMKKAQTIGFILQINRWMEIYSPEIV